MPVYTFTPRRIGRKPSAKDDNALREEVAFLSQIIRGARGGPGMNLAVGGGGLLISLLANMKDRFVLAKVTAAPTFAAPVKPSLCLYSARGIDRKIEMVDVAPDYGRQVVNDECWVYPEKVGNLCFIVRNPQAGGQRKSQLWIWNEPTCKGPCELGAVTQQRSDGVTE